MKSLVKLGAISFAICSIVAVWLYYLLMFADKTATDPNGTNLAALSIYAVIGGFLVSYWTAKLWCMAFPEDAITGETE